METKEEYLEDLLKDLETSIEKADYQDAHRLVREFPYAVLKHVDLIDNEVADGMVERYMFLIKEYVLLFENDYAGITHSNRIN